MGRAEVGEAAGAHPRVDAVHQGPGRAEQQERYVEELTVHEQEFDTSDKLVDYIVKLLD
ncbi:hypothetical protein GCM10010435_03860 [Winogradskya consettensis]|uniref:Uncharacterized protein n=1 Tax=Winogradskya consettensis TaxID=113560 RepID=A0A919SZ43_9ACTN|nr:hypothetical protein Aco04nite_78410 [Actinoplanes consettensis]